MRIMDAIERTTIFFESHYRNFEHPIPYSLVLGLSSDLQEAVMTKNYVLADVIVKTAYFSLAAMALVFVSMLYLTTIHP
jgi:hypothetical protein